VRAALATLALVAACGDLGCKALASSNVPAATQALEECVAGQLLTGATDPIAIGLACSVPAGADLIDLVEFLAQQLESAGKLAPGTTAKIKAARK
jgi:hypothetical protein